MSREELFGYSVNLVRLLEEDGGGWLAEVPELKGCLADGENPEEALNNLKEVVETWLEVAQEENKKIPEPRVYNDSKYSGRFTLRLPKTLHKELTYEAEREGVSLNQLVLAMVSYGWGQKTTNRDTVNIPQPGSTEKYYKLMVVNPEISSARNNPFKYNIGNKSII